MYVSISLGVSGCLLLEGFPQTPFFFLKQKEGSASCFMFVFDVLYIFYYVCRLI